MLNPLSTSLNPLSSDSELSGFKIRSTLTFYLGGTQWSPLAFPFAFLLAFLLAFPLAFP